GTLRGTSERLHCPCRWACPREGVRSVSAPEMPGLEIPDEVVTGVPESTVAYEAVVIVDFQGVVLGMNKPAEALFKMQSRDIAGEFVEMLVPAKKRWGHQAYRRGYQV